MFPTRAATNKANQVENKEIKALASVEEAAHLIEHLEDVLIDKDNVKNQEILFHLIFKELPTYEDLVNRTLNLQPLLKLKSTGELSKSSMVDRGVIETPSVQCECTVLPLY